MSKILDILVSDISCPTRHVNIDLIVEYMYIQLAYIQTTHITIINEKNLHQLILNSKLFQFLEKNLSIGFELHRKICMIPIFL
jgi:hypothetical protein